MVPCGGSITTNRSQIADLATVVLAPDEPILVIQPSNRAFQRKAGRVRELILAGDCVAVRVRPGLLAVDFDDPDPTSADQLTAELVGAGLDPVVLASGQEGRRHVWVRTDDLKWSDRARQLAGDVRRVIRVPGIVHRSGKPSDLLNGTALEAIERLRPTTLQPGVVSHWQVCSTAHRQPLPEASGVRLPLPDPSNYMSASEAVRAAACRYANHGAGPSDLIATMDRCMWSPWLARCSTNGRPRSLNWVRDYVWPDRQNVGHQVESHADLEAVLAQAYARAVDRIVGRPQPSALRVLEVLVARARLHQSLVVGLSVRQAAEEAGVSMATATKALSRLREVGAVSRVTVGRGGHGQILDASERRHLSDDEAESRTLRTPPDTPPPLPPAPNALPRSDVLSGAGLGQPTLHVYSQIFNRGVTTITDLLAASGQPPAQTRFRSRRSRNLLRQLECLEGAGLIQCAGETVIAVHSPDLERAAAQRDQHSAWAVTGRVERHQVRHARQRDSYLEQRAEAVDRRLLQVLSHRVSSPCYPPPSYPPAGG